MFRSATVLLILTIAAFSFSMAIAQTSTVRGEASLMNLPGGQAAVVLDVLSSGMNVEIMSVKGNWARIRIPATSEVGWVKTSALTRADAQGGDSRQVGVGMTANELERVEGRVERMSGGLRGIEQGIDHILERLSKEDQPGGQTQDPAKTVSRYQGTGYAPYAAVERGQYRWHNQFVMGTYVRGGQNYYGLEMSRSLDARGRNLLVARAQYGLGEIRGKVDDFIDWTAGMDFNLFPETYVIYPYFGVHFGMRHLFEDTLPDRHFFIAAPSLGVRAELGGIFTLGAELKGLFRFESGHRRDDGMVGFSCGYKW